MRKNGSTKYEVTFIDVRMISFIMPKYIVFGIGDEVIVQKASMDLSGVLLIVRLLQL